MGFYKTHEVAVQACVDQGAFNFGFGEVKTLEQVLGLLWGSPRQLEDGTARTDLEEQRFLLARQTAVAICNERLFGTRTPSPGLINDAVTAMLGSDCTRISHLVDAMDAYNSSGNGVALPAGFDPGPATPTHAESIADDPTAPSGEVCQ